jgi:hypothetical protein
MTLLAEVLGAAVALGLVSDAYMYLCARAELSKTDERLEKYFPFHWSQVAWMRAYMRLARSRSLPIWPVYTHWIAWPASVVLLISFLYRG